MDQKKKMSFSSRRNSFIYALNGLRQIFTQEPNAKLHAAAALIAVVAGIVRHISPAQWVVIIFAIGLVWITEALNTCIEKLCDYACKDEIHPAIKIIKDIAAGAVLIAAIVSLTAGTIVFLFWNVF
jgi:diacylglycerol kinase